MSTPDPFQDDPALGATTGGGTIPHDESDVADTAVRAERIDGEDIDPEEARRP